MTVELAIGRTRLSIVEGDITRQTTDAIVNAANSGLMGGGGVDGAIHRAGGPAILKECRRIRDERGRLPAGQAVITTGGDLKARHVIHTVGPVWRGGGGGEPDTLASAYRESLKLAVERGLRTVSFPSISTGAYGYPVESAARVALQTTIDFLQENDSLEEVVLVLFDAATARIYEAALRDLTRVSD
jgi:O-acetyl-ADP-ribose deacetylase (regulator of RNase III)